MRASAVEKGAGFHGALYDQAVRLWGQDDAESQREALQRTADQLADMARCELPLDILVKTPAEVAEAIAQHDGFIDDIISRGRVLYARAKLEFEKKVAGGGTCASGSHGVDVICSFADATGAWINAVNAANFAGHNDWRVPNIRELMSIVDYGRYNRTINPIFAPTAATNTWSSTSGAGSPANAWVVGFGSGGVVLALKTSTFRVRAVRGGW